MHMARNKKLKISEYWSTDPLLYFHIFRKIPNNCLFKIKMVLQDITNNFRSAMVPLQNLFIDENLVLWKETDCNGRGMLQFKTKLQPVQTESKRTRNMLAIKLLDQRDVHMLTTIHKNE
ncbi:piggyBac transposable element-derived protein 4-like [Aphis craccivora]|uniref:PiggyBac transposable element-derived protein 4-like n=1 Tax=Aphis craccivora TaxID=307492 RepID=A0A6G0W1L2_APHCR|nr:piggyBac transposable element-derived protein 4-like [Aphis craccivora]